MTPPEMSPNRVVVTGAARGIGAQIARRFAHDGGTVAIIDVIDPADVVDDIGGAGFVCDLTDSGATSDAMAKATAHLGGVDVLVNNAGIFQITPLLDITVDEWDRTFSVNTRSMLVTTQCVARTMISQGTGGRIINMASMGGKLGEAGQASYAASKAAVISLTQVAAAELGVHGITVNAICPGYVLTEMGADTRTSEQVADWSSKSPLGRCGSTDDIAGMAAFLASRDAAYLTGQALNVSGGMILH